EMVDGRRELLALQQGYHHRGAAGDPGNFHIESGLDQLLIQAQLYHLVDGGHDPVKTVEVGTNRHHFDVFKLKHLFVEFEEVLAHYAFPQVAQLDHDNHLVHLALALRLLREEPDCFALGVKTDIGVAHNIADAALGGRFDIHSLHLRGERLDHLEVANPAVADLPDAQIEDLTQVQLVATEQFCHDGPVDIIFREKFIQLPEIAL